MIEKHFVVRARDFNIFSLSKKMLKEVKNELNKKRIAILGSVSVLLLVLMFSFATVFLALGQSEPPNKVPEESEPSEVAAAPTYQTVDEYYIYSVTSNNGASEIRLYNDDDGLIGYLFFYPDGTTLPADYVDAYDDVILYYPKSDYEKCVDLLRNEYPVHLEYSSEYHGIYGAQEPAGEGEGESVQLQFDFGTESSPVEEGFIKVTDKTLWSYALGYGWSSLSGLSSRDRGAPDDLRRDFVQSTTSKYFQVVVPEGRYRIDFVIGDKSYMHDDITIYVESTIVLSGLDTAAGYFYNYYAVRGGSGISLDFYFVDDGGSDGNWVINAITITSAD
jgi:hypothetical protein